MKGNKIVETLCQVDFSELNFPLVTIYERPLDFPDAFVARVWDGKGAKPTNIVIKRSTVQEIREDDDPHIIETWMN
ncbi:MAG: hypothetical protein K2N63_08435 [Lachnospiraceae bacterium]|nr:hypothetical protein [Lachnospiraceae bacterium]